MIPSASIPRKLPILKVRASAVVAIPLTVALVAHQGGGFQHWARVSDVAAELKAYGKSHEGSIVVKERRTPLEQPAPQETVAPENDS